MIINTIEFMCNGRTTKARYDKITFDFDESDCTKRPKVIVARFYLADPDEYNNAVKMLAENVIPYSVERRLSIRFTGETTNDIDDAVVYSFEGRLEKRMICSELAVESKNKIKEEE